MIGPTHTFGSTRITIWMLVLVDLQQTLTGGTKIILIILTFVILAGDMMLNQGKSF